MAFKQRKARNHPTAEDGPAVAEGSLAAAEDGPAVAEGSLAAVEGSPAAVEDSLAAVEGSPVAAYIVNIAERQHAW